MGKASRRKKERKENPPQVPHLEVHAGLAAATGGVGSEMEKESN